jgi:hypothetical protein
MLIVESEIGSSVFVSLGISSNVSGRRNIQDRAQKRTPQPMNMGIQGSRDMRLELMILDTKFATIVITRMRE